MANDGQNFTNIQALIDEQEENCQRLLYQQQQAFRWFAAQDVDYYDLDEQGVVKRSSARKLAKELGVSRQTMYNWRKTVPDAEEQIKQAKEDILQTNIGSVWNALFLKACEGDVSAVVLYLSNFDRSFRLPSAKSDKEVQLNGLADLLNKVRQRTANNKVTQAS